MEHIKYEIELGEEIIIPIPKSYKDCIVLIRSDYFRHFGIELSFLQMFIKSLRNPVLALSFWLRLSSYKGKLYMFTRFFLSKISRKFGLHISSNCKIGYGLYIGHGFGTIINSTAIIGNNVNLGQFTTIGSNTDKAATIGDNVYVGPTVCIVEDVIIGSNSSIGAGAVVVNNVPKNATVAGVPARVISYKEPGRFIKNRYPI